MNTRPALMKFGATLVLLAAQAVVFAPAHADDARASREREAMHRAQQALRDAEAARDALQQQQATLTSEKTTLAADKDKLSNQLKSSTARIGVAQEQAKAAQARATQLESDLAQTQGQLKDAQGKGADLARDLQESRRVLAAVKARLAESVRTQALLEARNRSLYDVGLTSIELYRSKAPTDLWRQREPLLGLADVRIEESAEVLRTKLEDARYVPEPVQGATAAGSVPAASEPH
jgi:DNA repair exonuclease SbcCD ATPase subunit